MLKIKNNKLELLKALQTLVDESLEFVEVNDSLESEVASMLMDMKERKRIKKLKLMSRELDKWLRTLQKSPVDTDKLTHTVD